MDLKDVSILAEIKARLDTGAYVGGAELDKALHILITDRLAIWTRGHKREIRLAEKREAHEEAI